jgi:hypothetical protein
MKICSLLIAATLAPLAQARDLNFIEIQGMEAPEDLPQWSAYSKALLVSQSDAPIDAELEVQVDLLADNAKPFEKALLNISTEYLFTGHVLIKSPEGAAHTVCDITVDTKTATCDIAKALNDFGPTDRVGSEVHIIDHRFSSDDERHDNLIMTVKSPKRAFSVTPSRLCGSLKIVGAIHLDTREHIHIVPRGFRCVRGLSAMERSITADITSPSLSGLAFIDLISVFSNSHRNPDNSFLSFGHHLPVEITFYGLENTELIVEEIWRNGSAEQYGRNFVTASPITPRVGEAAPREFLLPTQDSILLFSASQSETSAVFAAFVQGLQEETNPVPRGASFPY